MNSLELLKNLNMTSPSIITIGTFDGVHVGHKYLINEVLNHKNKLVTTAIVFNRPPKEIISNIKIPMIMSLKDKNKIIKEMGIENLITLDFDNHVKGLSCKEFINILKENININILVLGEDTSLGKDKIGPSNGLEEILKSFGASLVTVDNKLNEGSKISSSKIKKVISDGNIKKANSFLSTDFSMEGKVIEGKKNGRGLGYPTANIELKEDLIIPKDGVYKTTTLFQGREYLSATSIGNNPTFNGSKKSIETYIINFNKDIYGENIKIIFKEFIRNQIKFNKIEELKSQMLDDINYILKIKE